MRILTILVVLIVGLMAYVRFSPIDAARWHVMPDAAVPGDTVTAGSFKTVRRITVPAAEVLTAMERLALATPRTQLLTGSVGEGMITFQTRSRLWGFPDYTTVAVQGDVLVIYGRLRFGKADLGVNKTRIEGWLETLGPLTEPI